MLETMYILDLPLDRRLGGHVPTKKVSWGRLEDALKLKNLEIEPKMPTGIWPSMRSPAPATRRSAMSQPRLS